MVRHTPGAARAIATLAVLGILLALPACVVPFPDTRPDGSSPFVVWTESPDPPNYVFARETQPGPDAFRTYVLTNPTAPAKLACFDGAGPTTAEGRCDTHYQGTGIVVLVPEPCRTFLRTELWSGLVPPIVVDVAGVQVSRRVDLLIDPVVGIPHAFYFTVSGPGREWTGWRVEQHGQIVIGPIEGVPTARVPEQDSYDVALTCAVGSTQEPGTVALVTYRGTVAHG